MGAKSRGPGPDAYTLPPTIGFNNHDIRKQRMPQYSFGYSYETSYGTTGPGPGCRYIENVTRYGGDGTPRYSLRPKISMKEKCKSPGPASNDVHKRPFLGKTKAPAFSLQAKNYPTSEKVTSPPPNAYDIKLYLTKPASPMYSLGGRLPRKPTVRSPGPAAYGRTDLNVKLNKSPAFSLTGRHFYWD